MLKIRKIIFIILLLGIAISSIVLFFKYQSNKNHKKFNVILIVIDALRADHLGCYGYKRDTSPNIDKFAKEGVLFTKAFSQGAATRISIPSIFTSLYPGVHKVLKVNGSLASPFVTLPELLKKKGYISAAFVGSQLTTISNFQQRFQFYEEVNIYTTPQITKKAIDWLKEKSPPFFLYIHYFDCHVPYLPPSPYRNLFYQKDINEEMDAYMQYFGVDRDSALPYAQKLKAKGIDRLDFIISQYDGQIRYVDDHIKMLLEELENLKLSENTLIILTSDHGEEFKDHGYFFHERVLYDELIHIPLIIRLPKILPQSKIIPNLVRHIDIMPTILDILKISSNNVMQGKSLLPLVREETTILSDAAFSEGYYNIGHLKLKGIRTDKWKFIEVHNVVTNTYTYELYDLENDPRELNNLVEEKPKEVSLFKEKLRDYTFSCQKIRGSILGEDFIDKPVMLDEETKERLRSLGYINIK